MDLDRQRAKHALAAVSAIDKGQLKNYVSYVKGLPATILQNGLGQAMATLLAASKGEPPSKSDHRRLYDQMHAWLCRTEPEAPYSDQTDLMRAITHGDEDTYVRAQSEALAYLGWLKKLTVAYLSKPEEEEAS